MHCFAPAAKVSPRTVSAEWRHFDAKSVITCRSVVSVAEEWQTMSKEERMAFENEFDSLSVDLRKKYPANYLRVALLAAENGSSEAARMLPNSCEEKFEYVEEVCPRDAAEMAFFRLARAMVDWRSRCNPLLPPLLDYSLDRAEFFLHQPYRRSEDSRRLTEQAAAYLVQYREVPSDVEKLQTQFLTAFSKWRRNISSY